MKRAAFIALRRFVMQLAFGGCVLAAIILWNYAGQVEGKVFPPVGPFQITQVMPTSDGRVAICGRYVKHRYCRNEAVSWAYQTASGFERVFLQIRGGEVPSKPAGWQGTCNTPWRLDIPWNDRGGRLVGVTSHRCHPFFETETKWFDGHLPPETQQWKE